MEREVIGCCNRGNVLIQKVDRNVESFVELVQLFSDKTAVPLKTTALVV